MTATTPATIAWLLRQSQAQRGREVQLVSTCPTFGDWVALCLSSGAGAGRIVQLLRVAYPEPTPVTVVVGINQRSNAQSNALAPKLYGFTFFTGVTPNAYRTHCGTALIEWMVAGTQFAVMVDLGANVVSLPACDQVTVSFFAHLPAVAFSANISVSAVPVAMAGGVATLTRAPVIVPAGASVVATFRSAWARRWKATASDAIFGLPGPVGPVVVQQLDAFNLADSAESVTFSDGVAVGVRAQDSGWIEAAGPSLGYVVTNLGAADIKAKIIEQVQVI